MIQSRFKAFNRSPSLNTALSVCVLLFISLLTYLSWLPPLHAVYLLMAFVCVASFSLMTQRPTSSLGKWRSHIETFCMGVWHWCLQCSFMVGQPLPRLDETKSLPRDEFTLDNALFFLKESEQRDVSRAVNILSKLASDGNVVAMYHLALCYRDAVGVEYSLSNALHWLQTAIKIHHLQLYVDEFTKLQARYLRYLETMAAQGCYDSQFLLGCYYRYECSLDDKSKHGILGRDFFKKASIKELSCKQPTQQNQEISYRLRASRQYILCCYDDELYCECIQIGPTLLDRGLTEVLDIVVLSLLKDCKVSQAIEIVRREIDKNNPNAPAVMRQLQENHMMPSTWHSKPSEPYVLHTPLRGFRPESEMNDQSLFSEGSESPLSDRSESPFSDGSVSPDNFGGHFSYDTPGK